MSRSRIAQLNPQFRVSLRLLQSPSPNPNVSSATETVFSRPQLQSVSSFHSSAIVPEGISRFHITRTSSPNFVALRWFSMGPNQPKSFTYSYLKDSLGFSERNAYNASKFVKFWSAENPEKVISVLKDYGLTQTQISDIARRIPDILVSDTEKDIVPKLEFLRAQGISDLNISKMIFTSPQFLKVGLDDQIRPAYDLVRDLFGSDEKANGAFRRWPHVLAQEFEKIGPNVSVLREHKVPDSNIAALLENQPRSLAVPLDRFQKAVKEVMEMGYDASRVNFVLAVLSCASMSKSTRKSVAGMDFFVNQPCLSDDLPLILRYSMKKRVIPRCSVLHVLLSNSSIKEKDLNRRRMLQIPEKKFVKNFISPYSDIRNKDANLKKLYLEKKGPPRRMRGRQVSRS